MSNFAIKNHVLNELKKGTKVVVVDYNREFQAFCKELGGAYIPVNELKQVENQLVVIDPLKII